jgi:GNAT superfamily N-acetyltransferase
MPRELPRELPESTGQALIRPFAKGDLPEAASAVAEAFQGSELYDWITAAESDPARFVREIFAYRVALGTAFGETDVAVEDGRMVGAAVWTPPNTYAIGHRAVQAALESLGPMTGAVARFHPQTRERWLGFFDLFLSARDAIIGQPFWALTPVAVLPESRGLGVASRLIRKKLARMDIENVPCFLGTQDDFSKGVYLHYGFEIIRSDPVGPSGLTSWSMIRRPRTPLPPPSGRG